MWCLESVVERIGVRQVGVKDGQESLQRRCLVMNVESGSGLLHGHYFLSPSMTRTYVWGTQLLFHNSEQNARKPP